MDKFNNQFATQKLREESVTSGGATFTPGTGEQTAPRATKKVVRKKVKKEVKDIPSDWTDATSIPNRPSKGGFIYKELWEELSKSFVDNQNQVKEIGTNDPILMAMRAKKDAPKPQVKKSNPNQAKINMLLKKKAEIERDMEQEAEPEGGKIADEYGEKLNKIDKAIAKLKEGLGFESGKEFINIKLQRYPKALSKVNNLISMIGENNFTMDMAEWIWDFFNNASFESPISEETLLENYSKFKNETKTRGTSDQFHQAVRAVKKKVQEINRLFEYVSRLKTELSEGEGGLKYKLHTEKALSRIKEMVAELNQNIKKFK